MPAFLKQSIIDVVGQNEFWDHIIGHERVVFGMNDLSWQFDLIELGQRRTLRIIILGIFEAVQRRSDSFIKLIQFGDVLDGFSGDTKFFL